MPASATEADFTIVSNHSAYLSSGPRRGDYTIKVGIDEPADKVCCKRTSLRAIPTIEAANGELNLV
jgi:hypothetical protein